MIRMQMMEQVIDQFQEVTKPYTSFRKVALRMKPGLLIDHTHFYFIGIYKGFLYGIKDENLIQFFIIDQQGSIVKDIGRALYLVSLYSMLLQSWITKEHIRGLLYRNNKIDEQQIPGFLTMIKRGITASNENVEDYTKVLSELEHVCKTKPKKRKKLPYPLDELKTTLFKPYNKLLEASSYTKDEITHIYQALTDENEIKLTQDWKETFNKYWIHY